MAIKGESSPRTIWRVAILPVTESSNLKRLREDELRAPLKILGPRSLEGYILGRASPYNSCQPIVRGSVDKPRPITIYGNIRFSVAVIVRWH